MPLTSGRRLGPYEVVASLATGGMGEVYRARDTRLGRDVALKILPSDRAHDPDRLQRFEREARAVAALDHPHILALHDLGSEDGVSYVVFELLEGHTLRHRLDRGSLPVRKCIEVGVQICRGLGAAHARGIVHRDLKPENVWLTADGRVTAGYMSPEQVYGQPGDARCDIFSLGAVLYEMLTARRAFEAGTAADTMSAILHHDPPAMVSASGPVPPGLERVVRRCLEKEPDERFQSARDLAFALESQPGASTPGAQRANDPRRWVRSGAVGLLVPMVAAAAFVWGSHRPPPLPEFKQLTFRRGMIQEARFSADGNTIAYSGLFDGNPGEVYWMRSDRPESARLDLPAARLVGLSSSGELAIILTRPDDRGFASWGTLARVPLSGGTPREIVTDVWSADWSPDGRELAVLRHVDGQAQLEYPIGHVLRRPFPFQVASFALRVSPRGDRVAVAADGMGVQIIDRAGNVIRPGSPGAALGSDGMAWDPGGEALWVAARGGEFGESSSGLWRLGLDGSARRAVSLPGPVMIQDVSRDARILVHTGFEREGVRARGPGEKMERDLCPQGLCQFLQLTPDGRRLLFAGVNPGREPNTLFVSPTSGGPPVRLGVGNPAALSPDGQWILSRLSGDLQFVLELIPMGPGTPRRLNTEGLERWGGGFFLDAGHAVITAGEAGRPERGYLIDLGGKKPIPVTPEGLLPIRDSAIGGSILAVRDRELTSCPLAGGEARPVAARLPPDARPLRMSADGRHLFLATGHVPVRIDRFDLVTGRSVPWRTLMPDDVAGVVGVLYADVTRDGSAYAYSYLRLLQDLYLVEGVR
jgi:hypothetical protein